MKIITEEMRYRKRLCEYAIKNGVTNAARRYHTNRKFVYRYGNDGLAEVYVQLKKTRI